MKPLAIDLYCGVCQAKFSLRANASVQEFVTGGAQYPEHARLRISNDAPRTISLELWTVGDLKNAPLSTGLARLRQIAAPARQAIEHCVPERSVSIVERLLSWMAAHPNPAVIARGLAGAIVRTISAVRAGGPDDEGRPTSAALGRRNFVRLLSAPDAPGSTLATGGAVALIWAPRLKICGTFSANEIIHGGAIA
jgi:hypothetical protein